MKSILLALALSFALAAHASNEIKTQYGIVSGENNGTAFSYKGIPYAAPPVGALRWQAPAPPAKWKGTRAGDHFSNVCPQQDLLDKSKLFGSEDCLYLNVFRPKTVTTPLPVMVFIHGGANSVGSASDSLLGVDLYDGSVLSTHNVIVVTLNYRLGALGFLAMAGLGNGNYALLDQIAALKFVRDNIAAFGGDPKNVTLFGESAGAIDTLALLTLPLARGLFGKAIVESGFLTEQSLGKAQTDGLAFAQAAGCEDAACLRAMTPFDLVRVGTKMNEAVLPTASLTVDGTILPKGVLRAMQDGDAMNIPVIIGTNADEMRTLLAGVVAVKSGYDDADLHALLVTYFGALKTKKIETFYPANSYPTAVRRLEDIMGDALLHCPARSISRALSKFNPNVYRYVFEHTSENALLSSYGAGHAMELPYVFSAMSPWVYTYDEFKLAAQIGNWWTTFATLGAPTVATQTPWSPAATDSFMSMDVQSQMAKSFHGDRCDFWDRL